jgi:transposase
MNKDIKYFGIDISYLVFDVTDSEGNKTVARKHLIKSTKITRNYLH